MLFLFTSWWFSSSSFTFVSLSLALGAADFFFFLNDVVVDVVVVVAMLFFLLTPCELVFTLLSFRTFLSLFLLLFLLLLFLLSFLFTTTTSCTSLFSCSLSFLSLSPWTSLLMMVVVVVVS